MQLNLYQTIVEIVENMGSEDNKVLGRYSYSVFAEDEATAIKRVLRTWQLNWNFPAGTGFTVRIERVIENGTLEGANEIHSR
jgi:hypothetical protein